MAIETGAIFKRLYFDGASSGDYGVYISGAGTFNAPARDIEMVSIPGRNGALALDKGRFENIEVTYKAGLFGVDEADFAEAISEFRNFLCSRSGYVRLEDDYNPDEYRMAVYKSGLDVKADVLKAGEFDLVFDCKPQRWLKSGETAVTVASGDILTNPTRFESGPLLEIKGYGTVEFNGYTVDVESTELGAITISDAFDTSSFVAKRWNIDRSSYNNGDIISLSGLKIEFIERPVESGSRIDSTTTEYRYQSVSTETDAALDCIYTGNYVTFMMTFPSPINFEVGTPEELVYKTQVKTCVIRPDSSSNTFSVNLTQTIAFGDDYIELRFRRPGDSAFSTVESSYSLTGIIGHSSVEIASDGIIVDCDFGEAYMIKDESIVSLNKYIDLGSDLPKLASGANEITFDNTITELKVHPRWWKV